MHPPAALIFSGSSMEDVMENFDRTGDWNLPVVDSEKHYLGMLSKAKIFSHYRHLLKKQAKEDSEIIE
jgi:chloride channel protein, CIC family